MSLRWRFRSGQSSGLSKRRLMHVTGHNIIPVGVPDRNRKYLSDLYTTLIDIQWRWNILIFTSGFVLTWLAFACFYFLLGYLHGDLVDPHLQPPGFVPCLDNVQSFTGAYLFSIETMTTIGYGSRSQTEECPGVYLAVMFQSILGAGLQFALASIVVSKTRKAKRRCGTVLFSDLVCIYEQDGRLQLAVRVGDMRRSEIVGAHAQGYLVKRSKSKDGSFVPVRIFSVNFRSESGRDELFLPWPSQILHKVDEDSPLWTLSRDEMLSDQYELIVVIDGVSGATSQPFQARKSYHASDMRWGHRFSGLDLTFSDSGSYVMNFANFHNTVPASTPLCSAQDTTTLRELYKMSHPGHRETCDLERNEGDMASSSPKGTSAIVDIPGKPEIEPAKSVTTSVSSKDQATTVSFAYRKALRSKRSVSMVENYMCKPPHQALRETPKEGQREKQRRFSLGDLIRLSQGGKEMSAQSSLPLHINDALNLYKHRRSITDTYLGREIEEEEEGPEDGSSQAILTIMSHASAEEHIDVRDVFKKRRSSASQLYFSAETGDSGDEGHVLGTG